MTFSSVTEMECVGGDQDCEKYHLPKKDYNLSEWHKSQGTYRVKRV